MLIKSKIFAQVQDVFHFHYLETAKNNKKLTKKNKKNEIIIVLFNYLILFINNMRY